MLVCVLRNPVYNVMVHFPGVWEFFNSVSRTLPKLTEKGWKSRITTGILDVTPSFLFLGLNMHIYLMGVVYAGWVLYVMCTERRPWRRPSRDKDAGARDHGGRTSFTD